MSNETFKMMLRQLFQSGEIEIRQDFSNKYDAKYSVVTVFIDGNRVYQSETYIGSSEWKDI